MPTTSLLQLLDAITRKGSEIGVKLVPSGGRTPALHFDFGFKIRSFFPRLVEPMSQPRNSSTSMASTSRASTADQ
jgi:aminocarboxymuconate-semialdehyde decarboxylase